MKNLVASIAKVSCAVLVVCLAVFVIIRVQANASDALRAYDAANRVKRELQVTTVKIEQGDTLWEIAEDFYTEDWGDLRGYVAEIKETNNLSSDCIHAGNYIVVPHY